MRPILFRWQGFTVWSYPAMLYAGLVAGLAAGNLAAHAIGVDPFRVFAATLVLIPPSIIGARLLYVFTHWRQYRGRPRRIWSRQEGGMAMYGALPVMLLLSAPLVAMLGLGFGQFWDAASFTIMTGMVFTKTGCLLNGCCAGRCSPSRIAVALPDSRGVWQKRIPVQCLEAAWAAVVLATAAGFAGRLPSRRPIPFGGGLVWRGTVGARGSARRGSDAGGGAFLARGFSIITVFSALAFLIVQWPR